MKSDKQQILSRIKEARPEEKPLPEIPSFGFQGADRIQAFQAELKRSHATSHVAADAADAARLIREAYPDARLIYSQLAQIPSSVDSLTPAALEKLDLAILKAGFAVADNGAVWISDESCPLRILPFIPQHLVVLVDPKQIKGNLHEAYAEFPRGAGFGVFITGPSKTGDIEQALVVGAQGPVSMTVVVVNDQLS